MLNELTPAQRRVLHFLHGFQLRNGFMPTRAEIASAFDWSSGNAADCHLRAMERRGAIAITNETARGIRFTDSGRLALSVVVPPAGQWPTLLALPVVDPCRSRAPGHYR